MAVFHRCLLFFVCFHSLRLVLLHPSLDLWSTFFRSLALEQPAFFSFFLPHPLWWGFCVFKQCGKMLWFCSPSLFAFFWDFKNTPCRFFSACRFSHGLLSVAMGFPPQFRVLSFWDESIPPTFLCLHSTVDRRPLTSVMLPFGFFFFPSPPVSLQFYVPDFDRSPSCRPPGSILMMHFCFGRVFKFAGACGYSLPLGPSFYGFVL